MHNMIQYFIDYAAYNVYNIIDYIPCAVYYTCQYISKIIIFDPQRQNENYFKYFYRLQDTWKWLISFKIVIGSKEIKQLWDGVAQRTGDIT